MHYTQQKQSGFVAILTVMFFTLLMTVVAIGFLRLMVQEQRQALQDDLSKGAYQAAQAGVEDAKRAILYCSSLTDITAKGMCESNLYRSTCPGFNADPDGPTNPGENYFKGPIGVPTASLSKGAAIGQTGADTAQGYSCVIVTRNTSSLNGSLKLNTSTDKTILELKTVSNYTRIRIKWHSIADDGTPYIPAAGTFINSTGTSGNPRLPHWPADTNTGTSAPAMLRLRTMAPQAVPFTVAQIKTGNFFVYPASSSTAPFGAANPYKILDNSPTQRYESKCVADPNLSFNGYACAVDITFTDAAGNPWPENDNRYLVLQAMYKGTSYEVTAYNDPDVSTYSTTPILFDGVQPTIDATGYQNGVYRRVKVGVRLGGDSFVTNAALDSGLGVCKDFRVGGSTSLFLNNCY